MGSREAGTRTATDSPRFPLPDPPGQHGPWCTQSVPTASAPTIFGRGHCNMRKVSRRKRPGSPCSPTPPSMSSNFEMMWAVTAAALNVQPDVSSPSEFRGRYRRPQLSPQPATTPVKNEPAKNPVGPNSTVDTKGTRQVQSHGLTPWPPTRRPPPAARTHAPHAPSGTLTRPARR